MSVLGDQLANLQRIAAFSAGLRGHQLGLWWSCEDSATACCSKCGRSVTVYVSLMLPDMDGTALAEDCNAAVVAA
jgi:hypothetical protein